MRFHRCRPGAQPDREAQEIGRISMHYVCSDIHGQGELYHRLLEKLQLTEEDRLYILGDVIDRGPDSIPVLQDVMTRDNVELFLGNHELMMLDYLRKNENRYIWFYGNNGGRGTWYQYMKLPREEKEKIAAYLMRTWVQKYTEVDGTPYALHHSWLLENRAGEDVRYDACTAADDVMRAVWYSPYRRYDYVPVDRYSDGWIHIIGHVPVQREGIERPPLTEGSLILIDGGCAYIRMLETGGLYCMSLETDGAGKRQEIWIAG